VAKKESRICIGRKEAPTHNNLTIKPIDHLSKKVREERLGTIQRFGVPALPAGKLKIVS
jgi:hypothetical protein